MRIEADQVLCRFQLSNLMSGVEVPHGVVRSLLVATINMVVHLERRSGSRFVGEIRTEG